MPSGDDFGRSWKNKDTRHAELYGGRPAVSIRKSVRGIQTAGRWRSSSARRVMDVGAGLIRGGRWARRGVVLGVAFRAGTVPCFPCGAAFRQVGGPPFVEVGGRSVSRVQRGICAVAGDGPESPQRSSRSARYGNRRAFLPVTTGPRIVRFSQGYSILCEFRIRISYADAAVMPIVVAGAVPLLVRAGALAELVTNGLRGLRGRRGLVRGRV